jgi:hypothetical protein
VARVKRGSVKDGVRDNLAQREEQPESLAQTSYGMKLRPDEWETVDEIAAEWGVTRHAVMQYALRLLIAAFRAGTLKPPRTEVRERRVLRP